MGVFTVNLCAHYFIFLREKYCGGGVRRKFSLCSKWNVIIEVFCVKVRPEAYYLTGVPYYVPKG